MFALWQRSHIFFCSWETLRTCLAAVCLVSFVPGPCQWGLSPLHKNILSHVLFSCHYSSSMTAASVGLSVGVPVTLTLLLFVSLPVCIICIASCASWRKRGRVVSYSVPTSHSRHETLVNYHILQNEPNEDVESALLEAPPPYPGTDYTDNAQVILVCNVDLRAQDTLWRSGYNLYLLFLVHSFTLSLSSLHAACFRPASSWILGEPSTSFPANSHRPGKWTGPSVDWPTRYSAVIERNLVCHIESLVLYVRTSCMLQ